MNTQSIHRRGAETLSFLILAAILLCVSASPRLSAAEAVNLAAPRTAQTTIANNEELFRAGEAQFDTLGSARVEDLTNLSEAKKGAGAGFNYFPWRSAGFGIEGRGEGVDGILIDATAASLIGRFPIEALRLAPEIKLGADYGWKERDWSVFAGLGLDYRISRHVALAGELRGVRPIAGAAGEHVLALLKLRFVF